jgi:hypothetical protein
VRPDLALFLRHFILKIYAGLDFRLSLSLLLRSALELLLHIATQSSYGIGAALSAMLHLLDDCAQFFLDLSLLLGRWWFDMRKLVLGNEGHDIMDEDAHGLYLTGDVEDVLIIDAWDKDGIDLHDLLELEGLFNAL